MSANAPRVLVVVPTYCEVDSLRPLVQRVLASEPEPSVLVVDDNSPDGTGVLADEMAAAEPRMQVLHRAGKEGLGPAYIAGFHQALDSGDFDIIVEMDADGSHQPEELVLLIAAIAEGADLAIGARWIPGGRTVHWPWYRKLISRSATAYARVMLRSHLHDITSGYRAFRVPFLASLDLDGLQSAGYAFQIEVAWRAERAGADIREVPITFVERHDGTSKMTTGIALEAIGQVTRWGLSRRSASAPASGRVPAPPSPPRS
ncbi:dolichol-phosphate mannosyltransferase [Leifsonia sp. Leaf325]|nr:polyprenol monophosphomannose synthase [Leifsonia sp. Leaf325]KQQ92693.1 dolichol-phosphate mannosyltransferase [Leifsonia sp. Leaf325]